MLSKRQNTRLVAIMHVRCLFSLYLVLFAFAKFSALGQIDDYWTAPNQLLQNAASRRRKSFGEEDCVGKIQADRR